NDSFLLLFFASLPLRAFAFLKPLFAFCVPHRAIFSNTIALVRQTLPFNSNRVVAMFGVNELGRSSIAQHRLPRSRCITSHLGRGDDLIGFGSASFRRSRVQLRFVL